MRVLYNEPDPFAAEWLENLSGDGLIPWGRVDKRPIEELRGADLAGVTQFHTFAGIGGWPLALRLAGWPEDESVWTGSCPCQPFSSAGKGKGEADERHLWPEFRRLIAECRPGVVLGEQVASAAGRAWLAGVRADLEALGYAVGAADLCAAGVGAPHLRQRLYWVAHRDDRGRQPGYGEAGYPGQEVGLRARALLGDGGADDGLADGEALRRDGASVGASQREGRRTSRSGEAGEPSGLAQDAASLGRRGRGDGDPAGDDGEVQVEGLRGDGAGLGKPDGLQDDTKRSVDQFRRDALGRRQQAVPERETGNDGASRPSEVGPLGDPDVDGRATRPDEHRSGAAGAGPAGEGPRALDGRVERPWHDSVLLPCTDGTTRRVGRGVFPLAHGIPRGLGRGIAGMEGLGRRASANRRGRLKGYGNAIVPGLAALFVMAYLEARDGRRT